jgi:hypothetical protein
VLTKSTKIIEYWKAIVTDNRGHVKDDIGTVENSCKASCHYGERQKNQRNN